MTRAVVARIVREKRMFMLPLLVALLANVAIAALVVYPMTIGVAQAEQEEPSRGRVLQAAEVEFAAVKATLADKSRAEQDSNVYADDPASQVWSAHAAPRTCCWRNWPRMRI